MSCFFITWLKSRNTVYWLIHVERNKHKLFCDTKLLSCDKIGQVLFPAEFTVTICGVSPRVGCGRQIRFVPGLQADLFRWHGNMVKLDDNVLLLVLLFTFIQEHYSNIALMLRPFPCEITPWKSMEIRGIPWKLMEIDGIPWNFHGVSREYPWSSMEYHGVPWSIHGVPWSIDGGPWNSMEYRRVPWNAMGFPEVPWSSMECHNVFMEFDRIPCSLYEKIHRNSVIKQLINLLTTCSSLHFYWIEKIGNIWKLSKSKIVSLV